MTRSGVFCIFESMNPTTALRKIVGLRKKIRAVQGGQGAGKTYSIVQVLINHAAGNAGKEIVIGSAELTKMRLTVIKDFVKIMKSFGIYHESNFVAGTLYRFPNGSFIKFVGLDKEDIGKGLRGDVFYLNEADKVNFETYREIASRFKHIYIDYNPNAKFWVHDEIIPRADCDYLCLTFQDNEYLDPAERDEILLYFEKGYGIKWNPSIKEYPEPVSKYWANKWRVYGLGEVGIIEGAVFENWEIIDELPSDAKLLGGGIDFGYVNPAAAVLVYQWNDHYIFDELIYETKLSNADMAEMIIANGFDNETWYADNAEPKSIAEIRKTGVRIHPCDGKTDLINYAVKIINSKPFYVTKRSVNVISELQSYIWDIDSKGQPTGKPRKKDDHAMNALCYFVATDGKYSGLYR